MKLTYLEIALITIAAAVVVAISVNLVSDEPPGASSPSATVSVEAGATEQETDALEDYYPWLYEDEPAPVDIAAYTGVTMTVAETMGVPPGRIQTNRPGATYKTVLFAEDGSPILTDEDSVATADPTVGDGKKGEKGNRDANTEGETATALDVLKSLIESTKFHRKALNLVLQELDGDTIEEALWMVESMEWGPEANMILQGLMTRWGQVDPDAATSYAGALTSRRARNSSMSKALSGWATVDPRSAYKWFEENSDIDPATLGMSVKDLFSSMAKQDKQWALDKVWELENRSMKLNAFRSVYRTMDKTEKEGLIEYYSSMPSGPDKALVADAIVSQWVMYEPEKAAEWIDGLKDKQSRAAAMNRLVSAWGYDMPDMAGEWILGLPQGERWTQVNRLVGTWSRQDPIEAADWLGQFSPSKQLDPAVQTLVRSVMKDDPMAAALWAETIVDKKRRISTTYQVASTWMKGDPKTARTFVETSDMPKSMKRRLLGRKKK